MQLFPLGHINVFRRRANGTRKRDLMYKSSINPEGLKGCINLQLKKQRHPGN